MQNPTATHSQLAAAWCHYNGQRAALAPVLLEREQDAHAAAIETPTTAQSAGEEIAR